MKSQKPPLVSPLQDFTLPELRRDYEARRRALVMAKRERGLTQTQAARELGVSLQALNNLLRREGIDWPHKRQGLPRHEAPGNGGRSGVGAIGGGVGAGKA